MQDSTEIGWIITNKDSDKYVGPILDSDGSDDNGIPGTGCHPEAFSPNALYVETHPLDNGKVFVSLGELDHGTPLDDLEESTSLYELVWTYIKKFDPEAVIIYGIIYTRR
jgi:hypothetical protein